SFILSIHLKCLLDELFLRAYANARTLTNQQQQQQQQQQEKQQQKQREGLLLLLLLQQQQQQQQEQQQHSLMVAMKNMRRSLKEDSREINSANISSWAG